MIDVVFLLIIFFLVASYFVRSEQSREVSLPQASKGKPDDFSAQKRLTITVEKDGRLSIAGNVVTESEVIDRIRLLSEKVSEGEGQVQPDVLPEVRIRSDRDARYGEIRRLIEQCASHKIRSIKFAVAQSGFAEP
jgi:biopolymer transport protein ExbD